MNRLKNVFAMALLVTSTVACGGSDQGSDAGVDAGVDAGLDAGVDAGGDEGPLPLSLWCQRLSEAYCDFLQRCPVPGQTAPSLPTCLAATRLWCADGLLVDMEALGWIDYSPAQAEACLTEMTSLDCQEFDRAGRDLYASTVCGQVTAGEQAATRPCVSGFECQSGVCQFSSECPGSCAAEAQLNGDCSAGQVCPEGSLCWEDACLALPDSPGEACPQGICAWPLMCRIYGSDNLSWTCAGLGLEGEACGPEALVCFPGLFCKRQMSDGPGLCAVPGTEGSTCRDNSECFDPDGPVLLCSGGTCLPAPSAGEPCEEYLCDLAWCDTQATTPTCVALAQQGQPCIRDSRCAPELFCLGGLCQPRLQANESCAEHSWGCAQDLICRAERCVHVGAPVCAAEE